MRIIAGTYRSRRIQTPPDAETTRPMPDRVREAVFNLLRGHVEGETVVDAFAGTGAIGLEALSRGAAGCVFIERARQIQRLLRSNIESLDAGDRARVVTADALGAAALTACPDPVHLVFFDPPYPLMRRKEDRKRVLDQLGRFIQRLDDTGFAVLRTPLPLFEEPPDEERPTRSTPDADLRIAGALGPETHDYGSMAVHLYMRDQSASS